MLRKFICLLLILSFVGANAQNRFPSGKAIDEYEIVAGGGLLLNRGNDYAVQDRMNKFGYSVGLGINRYLSDRFLLNLRVLYELKGFKSNENYINLDGSPGSTIIERSINYVTLSLMPTYLLGSQKNISVGLGCFYGFLQTSQDELVTKDQNNQVSSTRNFKTSENVANDFGIGVKAGYSFRLKNEQKIKIEILDNVGLVYFTSSWGYPIKSNSLLVVLSYSFKNK